MKKFTILLFSLLLVFLFFDSALSKPQLTIPDPVFDFGYVPQNSKISHVFWLYSTGTDTLTDTLKIINVRPG